MPHILELIKHLQHCSNVFGGQVCNIMYVGMLLVVLYVKGLRMLTRPLLVYFNHYQYQTTNLTTGPSTSLLAYQKSMGSMHLLFVLISLGSCAI